MTGWIGRNRRARYAPSTIWARTFSLQPLLVIDAFAAFRGDNATIVFIANITLHRAISIIQLTVIIDKDSNFTYCYIAHAAWQTGSRQKVPVKPPLQHGTRSRTRSTVLNHIG